MQPGDGGVGVDGGSLPRSLRYDFTPDYVLLPETTRYQAFGAFNHIFDNDMEAFAQAFYYRAESVIANAASPISSNSDNDIYVPASNYYNPFRSEEHTSELQSLMPTSYAVFCLKKKKKTKNT